MRMAFDKTGMVFKDKQQSTTQSTLLAKVKWLLLMPLLLSPPYVLTNRVHIFKAHEVPRVFIDTIIPFMPELSWLYLALFPFMWWAVLRQRSVLDAKRFVLGGAAISWLVSIVFLIYPTTFSREDVDCGGIYSWVASIDTHYNACPSLHGAYAVYAGIWIMHAVNKLSSQLLALLMIVLIFYATIAVRQHGIIDLCFGGIVGLTAFFYAQNLFKNGASCTV
jgi:hypothetical protein